ncbi:MAG: universal stress protein [Anaerolineae bacterium]|nr:universal stress protein [Anaerolineae bacterium]MCI0609009.1 universal stress protein [Anaerolineae bacterium]
MINHILVPLDNSTLAECVLPHILAIAPVLNARVTLLHVMEHPHNGNGTPGVDPVDWHLRKHKSERYLEQIAERLQISGLSIEYSLLEGSPAQSIIEFARNNNVDLITLSTHGNSGLSGWNVSSVVQKILLRSYKSTLLVRAYKPITTDSSEVRYKRLFIGLDCSTRAEYVLPVAMRLAQAHKSELMLGTVIQKPQTIDRFPLSEKDSKLISPIVDKNQQAASHYFDQLLTQFSLEGLELKTDIVVGDNVVAVLHDMVEEINADLVMLVAHGHSGERRWPYGSVTSSFIAYGNTPLMIMQDLSEDEIQHTHAELAVKEGKGH